MGKTIGNIKSNKNIVLGSVISYITIGINVIFGFFSIPLIIKWVGDSGYGLFTLATSVINVFVIDFGLGNAASHHLSKALANNDDEHFKDTASLIFRIFTIMDIVFGLTILFILIFAQSIFKGLTISEIGTFRGIFTIVGIFSLIALPSTIFNSILSAHEKFFFIKSINLATRVLYIIIVLIVLFLGGGLYGLVITHVLTEIGSILIKYFFVRFKLKTKIILTRKISKEEKKAILGFSIWAGVQALSNRLSFNIAPSILGITTNSKEIAIFGVSATFENYISMIGGVMSGFFLPRINRIKTSENATKELEELAYKVGKIQAAIVLLIMIGFISSGEAFISLWIKSTSSYNDVYLATILAALPNVIFSPQLVLYTAMFTDARSMKHLAFSSIIKAVVFLSLIFPLSINFGAIGAALSIFISKSIEIIIQNIFYKKDLGFNLITFYKKSYTSLIIPSILSLIIGLLIRHFIKSPIINLLVAVFVITFIFSVSSLLLLPKTELNSYKNLFVNIFRKSK